MNEEFARAVRARVACLADASRFRIVLALAGGSRCVTALAHAIGRSQSCTTRHLQALARHGLVEGRRNGRQVLFELKADRPEVRWFMEWVHAEPGASAAGESALAGADLHRDRPARRRATPASGPGARPTARSGAGRSGKPARQRARSPLTDSEADARPAESAAAAEEGVALEAPRTVDLPARRTSDLEDYLL